MVYFFCSDLHLFSKKLGKIIHANRYKMVDTKGPSVNTRTSLPKSAKASSLFLLSYICMGGIGKLFKPKTWSFHLNSQRMFKNYQYFMISKSNFGAFFSRQVFPMRYNSESLEILVVISGNVLLFIDIKISSGLLITAQKMPALFWENRYLKVSTTTNNLIIVSAVEPKIPSTS